MPESTEHDVTCANCGKSWRDSHQDEPGAEIWCGECERPEDTPVPIGYCPRCGKAQYPTDVLGFCGGCQL